MGFPQSVRDQILIDAARHCCVCHRYKGVKVEVHHIEPEASGGENIYENAIALCFDCHADSGHYNPKHPRGTKFSPVELRKAKENWFEMVESHNIQQPTEPDNFYCRYYLCKNYEQLVEIAKGDLSKFPVENPLLIKNEVINSLSGVIENHPDSYRHANAWGKSFSSREKYRELNPGAVVPSESDGRYSYFKVIRTPSREELEELKSKDGLLKLMLDSDLSVEQIAMVGGYEDGCGGVPLQEEFIFRKLWCAFLAITNISSRPVALDSVIGKHFRNTGFAFFIESNTEHECISLPKVPIPPNTTVLLPLALILPPFYPLNSESWSQAYDGHGHVQTVYHEGIKSANYTDYLVCGNQLITNSIQYKLDGNIAVQNLHDFDLSNMYTIDRFWECGSCPHLFLVGERISYSREILAHCSSSIGVDRFRIPDDTSSIIIAEIEDEVTEITSLKIDVEMHIENICLKKYQSIEIPVRPGSQIEIVGQYIPDTISKDRLPCGIKRNELVSEFLRYKNYGLTNACTGTK